MIFSAADQAAIDAAFGITVTATLNLVSTTLTAVYKVESGYPDGADTRELITRHWLVAEAAAWSGITRHHTITVNGTLFKIFGQPAPRNDGRLIINLVKA